MTSPKPAPEPQIAYSVEQFGRLFSIGRSFVFEEIRAGRLRALKIGRRTVITHADAMTWLTSLRSVEPGITDV